MKMNFREWLEAKSLMKTVPTKDGSKNVAKVNSNILMYHFAKSKRPVRSKVRELILGWEIWFLNEINLEEDAFIKRIEKYKSQIHRVLAGLQSIGVRKSNRVPIIIHFGERGAYGTAAGGYTASTFDKIDPASSKEASSVLSGLSRAKSSYSSQFKNIKDSSVIHIYRTVDLENLPVVLAHEIAHSIYNGLSNSQKEEITRLANSTASPSDYGRPDYDDRQSHVSGNEWFAEMIAKIVIYSKQGYDLDHGPDDDTWGNYIDIAVKVKDILSGKWVTSRHPNVKNWSDKTLANIQNMLGHNRHPSPSDEFRKDKNVKVPKRLRGKFSVDNAGRLR